jgi:Flp pilus assembly protein TadD
MNSETAGKRLNEARRLLAEQDFAEAQWHYETLVKFFPRQAQVWFEYGCAACGMGQFDLAEGTWRKALELEPNNSEMLRQMGVRYQDFHFADKARASFERAVAVDSRDINSRLALARWLEKNHRLAEAREAVSACLNMDARDEQARCFNALLDWRENKIADAERGLRDLISSGPKQPNVQYGSRYQLAEVLDRTERFDEAMETLAEAKRLVSGLADVPVMLKQYDQFEGKYRHTFFLGQPR